MDEKQAMMSDQELDRLLNAAAHPERPLGAEQRLMRRIALEQPASPKRSFAWLSAVPLAASLAFGFYLGQTGVEVPLFETQAVSADEGLTGFEDLEAVGAVDAT